MGSFERGIQQRSVEQAKVKYGPRLFIRVKHGDAYAVVGDPDLYGALDGIFFGFEVKNEEGRLSKIQIHRLHELQEAGCYCGSVRSAQEVMELLDKIDYRRRP